MAELIVEMTSEPIELCKLLKIADLVSGGGEAKVVISEGYVSLNGEVEYQKRKKIYHGDVVGFNGDFIEFNVVDVLDEPDQNKQELFEASFDENADSLDNAYTQNAYSPKQKPNTKPSNFKQNPTKPNNNQTAKNKAKGPLTKNSPDNKSKRRPISF